MDLTALSTATTTATALSNLILVSPQKNIGYLPTQRGNQSLNVETLLFNYEGEQRVNLKSDVTDHFIEDNTAINDQVALRPEVIRAVGYVGELNDVTPAVLQALRLAAEKLTIVNAYLPNISATALIAYNTAAQVYQLAEIASQNAVASWNSINNARTRGTAGQLNEIGSTGIVKDNGNQTKQQKMFQQFYGYWRSKTLFKVQTPWAIFENCIIEDLVAIQDEQTNVITDFEVMFKMLRFAKTQDVSSEFNSSNAQGRTINQSAQVVDLGTQSPVQSIGVSSKFP